MGIKARAGPDCRGREALYQSSHWFCQIGCSAGRGQSLRQSLTQSLPPYTATELTDRQGRRHGVAGRSGAVY